MSYREYFKEKDRPKNIIVIGLGPHGEMIADIKFLIRLGAYVSLYDLRSEKKLSRFIPILNEAGIANMSFSKVPADDLLDADLIIISPEISKKSLFLKKALDVGIPAEYPNLLFLKLAPPITLIGVLGSCGKSTVSHMIYSILKKSFAEYEDQGLYLLDPDSTNGALANLKKVKSGDVVLARIPEGMLYEHSSLRISPHVAVITSLTSDALHGSKGAFDIIRFQTHNNFIVAPDIVVDTIKDLADFTPKAKMLRTHNDNASLALQTSELFKVTKDLAQSVIMGFSGLKGRQELVKKLGGVEFYNDGASVVPHSTLKALQNLSTERNIILIIGGAYNDHDYSELVTNIPLYAKMVILLPGSGSIGLRDLLSRLHDIPRKQVSDLEEAVVIARENSKKGDRVLFSPACEAIGVDISRKERIERFVRAVRSL